MIAALRCTPEVADSMQDAITAMGIDTRWKILEGLIFTEDGGEIIRSFATHFSGDDENLEHEARASLKWAP